MPVALASETAKMPLRHSLRIFIDTWVARDTIFCRAAGHMGKFHLRKESVMLHAIARNWWMLFLRGLCAVIFGILAFAWPGITLASLILIFGVYAIIDGVTALSVGIGAGGRAWWQMIVLGLLGIGAGIVAFAWPALTALTLLSLIAAWSIIRGIVEIMAAIQLRAVVENEWMLILGGICSILFGIIVIVHPSAGALAVLWIIGAYAIVFGLLAIMLSFRLKSLNAPRAHGGGNAAVA
jgi:uncharacterized membrane protein HdeD (DUF308 family)